MKAFRQLFQSTLTLIVTIILCRLYITNFAAKQVLTDAITIIPLIAFNYFSLSRSRSPSTLKLTISNWSDFWHDFMALIRESGYSPICQMGDCYFFELRWMGQSTLITLKKISQDQWEIEYPQGLHRLVSKRVGIYNKMFLLGKS